MKLHPLTVPAGVVSFGMLAAAGLMSLRVTAGPLNPPSGAVSSTYKTLTEVEPRIAINSTNTPGNGSCVFVISQPGSYYLTGNVTGESGKHGIAIAASGVTIDLNGFAVIGVPGSFDGVTATAANLRNLEVRDGAVRNWGSDGVDFFTVNAVNCLIRNVRADGNAGWGITPGDGSTISGCTASNNTSNGMTAKDGSTIVGCTAFANGGAGIASGVGCTISNCSASSNDAIGYLAGGGTTIMNCTARSNTSGGFSTGDSCTISSCSTSNNGGAGLSAGNTCTILGCSAVANNGNGFVVLSTALVADCISQGNMLDGIQCSGRCIIRGNTCSANGNGGDGAGVHVTLSGGDCRIESNNCSGADRGIDVDSSGNILIRNTCSGNAANWDIGASNFAHVVVANPAGAFSGSSGGTSLGSTEPDINYTY